MFGRFIRIPKVQIGLALLAFFVVVAIFGPWYAGEVLGMGPLDTDSSALGQPPSADHPLGTTSSGQDVLVWMILGTRASMLVGVVSAVIGTAIALIAGLVAGYFGGWTDRFVNAFILVFNTMPTFAVLFMIAAIVPSASLLLVALIIGLLEWSGGARAIRAQALSLRNREFTTALKTSGESGWRIVFSESVPHLFGVLSPMILRLVSAGIAFQAAIAFIGIGDAGEPSWGLMIQYATSQNALYAGLWWWFLPPGLAIAMIGFATSMINFGLDEVTNPSLSSKRLSLVRRYEATIRRGRRRADPEAVTR